MKKVLVIDDEGSIRRTLSEILGLEGIKVDLAEDGQEGLDMLLKKEYTAAFLDIKMPKMDGIEVLEKAVESGVATPIIMISGHGDIQTAVDCMHKGAYTYIEKPLDLNALMESVNKASQRKALVEDTAALVHTKTSVQTPQKEKVSKINIIGNSEALMSALNLLDKAAASDARLLITGPNGSGKELMAQRAHEQSPRANGPFVEVNCAAIPSELIESELFGHEKGSFTGAHAQKKGKFELADGGTIFLDELGDMSLSAQAKVLRALQEHKITRVGGDKDIPVNVRVIAATNKDLKDEIAAQRFREDLFHRVAVIEIHVPALNDRKTDIPLLFDYFINQLSKEYNKSIEVETGVTEALQKLNYTGNIRQFRNIVERLVILSEGKITVTDVKLYANI